LLWFGDCAGGLEQRVSQPVYAWFLPLFAADANSSAHRLRSPITWSIVVPLLIIIGFVAIAAWAPVQ
jgi:hypothetical protein